MKRAARNEPWSLYCFHNERMIPVDSVKMDANTHKLGEVFKAECKCAHLSFTL